jgi:phenylacetate-CoA ligase
MNHFSYKVYDKLRLLRYPWQINPDSIYKSLMESQYWGRRQLEEYQLTSLNELLSYARRSRFYADIHKDLQIPLKNLDEVFRIPVVTKADLQNSLKELSTGQYLKKGWPGRSSGSTGKPSIIYLSQLAMAYRNASKYRFFSWWNYTQYDRWINFTAYPRSTDSQINKIKVRMTPRMDVDIFSINNDNVSEICRSINDYSPAYFRGYVSALVNFGKLVQEKKISMPGLKLRNIIVTSEILYEADRSFLENVFQCRVANEYGAAEAGLFACECPEGGMHIQEESLLFNVNKDNEVISTEFHNTLIPLINYKVGDKVLLSDKKCKCGRVLKLIQSIEGRIGSDEIITSDGRRLNYLFFDRMIKNLGNTNLWGQIKRFQIIQDGSAFLCYIVRSDNYSEDLESYIERYIKDGVGSDTKIEFIYREEIEPEKSGKYRIFRRI